MHQKSEWWRDYRRKEITKNKKRLRDYLKILITNQMKFTVTQYLIQYYRRNNIKIVNQDSYSFGS